jgi:molecular chaperone DnaJ
MRESDHYQTLGLDETATQAEIKQAYRRLAKLHHPDSQSVTAASAEAGSGIAPETGAESGHDLIARINSAYEVLGDPQARHRYDAHRRYLGQAKDVGIDGAATQRSRHQRTVDVQNQYRQRRQAEHQADAALTQWLKQVYNPVDRAVASILNPLKAQVRALSADPFDDDLMLVFTTYLEDSRRVLEKAKTTFKSMPNPGSVASVAANLYYCLNQLEDGLDEMERFTCNYDDSYLHTGQELFRISKQLRREASAAMKSIQ